MKVLIAISALAIISLLAQLWGFKNKLPNIILIGLLATVGLNALDWNSTTTHYFSNMLVYDNFAVAFSSIIIGITALLVMLSKKYYDHHSEIHLPDTFAIMLFSLAGAICMVSYGNLAMFFLGIELLSISLYALVGSHKRNLLSNEAALKYFLMGSVATSIMLFGITLIYGVVGSFELAKIAQYATANSANLPNLFYLGIVFMTLALGFKVSAAPFHFWAPDVYEGAPTFITAFMATVVKIAGFAAFIRLYGYAFAPAIPHIQWLIILLSVLTMVIANFSALAQQSFKRILAYSGVAQAGYLLIGLLSAQNTGYNAVLYYVAAYSVATIAAFAVLLLINYKTENNDDLTHFKGLAAKNKFAAATLTIAMLSLAGIPPTAGFFAKYYLFAQALQNGHTAIVVVAVLNSLISLYYYFKVIIYMYSPTPEKEIAQSNPLELNMNTTYKTAIAIATICTLALGLYPRLLAGIF